ncbi:MAG: allophanate hydrolase [Steroidobacteraceae bacterium]
MSAAQSRIDRSLAIADLALDYRERRTTPVELIELLLERIAALPDRGIWISRVAPQRVLEQARALCERDPASLPLYGIPFAIKDNIDLAGTPTTAGCPAFAYTPAHSAFVVQRLIDAGAIPIGKTNLDQFATGLVGTRSPYGVCHNSFDPEYISGGSSSGSAVAVAMGLASFALGTDTAGSGRIPAAFNNLIGLKPSLGRLSTGGVVPACRTLDAVSIFAFSAADAARVCRVAEGFDEAEPYSRRACAPAREAPGSSGAFQFGVPQPEQLSFFGNDEYPRLFDGAIARLEALGGQRVPIDFTPFIEAGQLLYEGPWVAERFAVIESLLRRQADAVYPVTRQIIEGGASSSAVQAFRALYRLQALRRASERVWNQIDVLLTPTAGTIYRIAEVEADPVRLNSRLGYYTNCVNLLDLAAVAVPAGFNAAGLPFGITLIGPVWSDFMLLGLAARFQHALPARQGALACAVPQEPDFDWSTGVDRVAVAVCGAHLSGLPLNYQLRERGAVLLERTQTAAHYRLYALPGGPPYRPGMVRVAPGIAGVPIEVEVWSLPRPAFGGFVAMIPAPLGIGKVQLANGREVCGFLCEGHALVRGAEDISHFGGWRSYLAKRA